MRRPRRPGRRRRGSAARRWWPSRTAWARAGEVAEALPGTIVITAVSYQAATLVAEGEVRHVANLVTYLGYEGRPPDEAVRRAADVLNAANIPAKVAADMAPLVWGKLILNAAINPVAALAGEPNGRLVERPALRALAQAIAEEGEAVARAEGIIPQYPAVAAGLHEIGDSHLFPITEIGDCPQFSVLGSNPSAAVAVLETARDGRQPVLDAPGPGCRPAHRDRLPERRHRPRRREAGHARPRQPRHRLAHPPSVA